MAVLVTKAQFLALKPQVREIQVEGLGTVRLQQMDLARRTQFVETLDANIRAVRDHRDDPKKHPYVDPISDDILGLVFSIVDGKDELMFDVNDIPALKKLPSATLTAIYLEVVGLSRVDNIVREVEAEKKG